MQAHTKGCNHFTKEHPQDPSRTKFESWSNLQKFKNIWHLLVFWGRPTSKARIPKLNQKAEAHTSPFLPGDRLACPSWFSATQPSITVKFELWNLICLGSDPGIAVYWLCNLTNSPSLSFLIYKMEVIINLHGLLGGLKDNEHGALYINTPQVLVSSILPLSSFAAVWPRLTSQPAPSSTRSRLLYWACVWRCTCCCRIWRRVTQCSLWVDLSQKDRSLGSANVILHLVDQHTTGSWLGSSFHTPKT